MGIFNNRTGPHSYTTYRKGVRYRLEGWREPPEGTPEDVVAEAERNGLKVLRRGEKLPLATEVTLDELMEQPPAGFSAGTSARKNHADRLRERMESRAARMRESAKAEKQESQAVAAEMKPTAGSEGWPPIGDQEEKTTVKEEPDAGRKKSAKRAHKKEGEAEK